MKYYDYTVDSKYECSDGSIKWSITGNGAYIIGKKGSNSFFIKRRFDPIYPDKSLPKEIREHLLKEILPIANKQKELQKRMKVYDTFKDHIAVELELIEGDMENRFVTITYKLDGLGDEFDYTKMSFAQFLDMSKEMANALSKLHKVGVIHGDLKPKNFVISQDGTKYIPYVIDFDSSYIDTEIPMTIPGSAGYFSPEALLVNEKVERAMDEGIEDLGPVANRSVITPKVDVFTLALVYHVLWSGVFPNYSIDYDSVASAINAGTPITISSKFNLKIGEESKATFKSLLNWMITKDITNRPTMDQVIEVLNDKLRVPSEYHVGDDELNIKPILWQQDILLTQPFDVKQLEEAGVEEFYPSTKMDGEETVKIYTVKLKGDSNLYNLTINELFEKGILKKVESVYDEPFDDDNAEFVSPEELLKLGIIKIERYKEDITNRNRYRITKRDIIFSKGINSLIQMGIARIKPVSSDVDNTLFDEPYSSDLVYNKDRILESKIKSIKRSTPNTYTVSWEGKGDFELPEATVESLGFLVRKV